MKKILIVLISSLLTLQLTGCAGNNPIPQQGAMAPCPDSPNCVSSRSEDKAAIEAFSLRGEAVEVWPEIIATLEAMPRTIIVEQSPGYIHATATSLVFRFVDDLELELLSDGTTIDVRSASRTGHSDMGVNRKRVETLRQRLQEQGIID